jgi:hypothetical protein
MTGKGRFRSCVGARPRGRPSALSKFLALQRDLFPAELAVAKVGQVLTGGVTAPKAAGPSPAACEDAAPAAHAALGKPIRILLSADEAEGA